ncbi:putative zinc-binding metallopeptidase [Candidatus Gracilibacteria bacterium]|nr:putative zinc-binding metallopeptidase [Candidatus Gracilibacteria bacterium]
MFTLLLTTLLTFQISLGTPVESDLHNVADTNHRQSFAVKQTNPFPRTFSLENDWQGHFSAKNFRFKKEDQLKLNETKGILENIMAVLPQRHINALRDLELRNITHPSRGMANKEKLILHLPAIGNQNEFTAVFIHEMGHIVDLGMITSINGGQTEFYDNDQPVFAKDQSVQFYRLSWQTSYTIKPSADRKDFVSGYAMTNVFEDFAESYLFYRAHGEKFREIMVGSEVLQQKYAFLKNVVFAGQEFQKEQVGGNFVQNFLWDATQLPIGDLVVGN